jgi:hypothetical protein
MTGAYVLPVMFSSTLVKGVFINLTFHLRLLNTNVIVDGGSYFLFLSAQTCTFMGHFLFCL